MGVWPRRAVGVVGGGCALARRHDDMVRQYLDAGVAIGIERDMGADASPPRGWYLAAAGRALVAEPDLMIDWL